MIIELFSLAGKKALVIGGSRGLGKGMARGLAEAGADVAVSSGTVNQCEDTAQELSHAVGHKIIGIHGDISTVEGAGKIVSDAIHQLGGLDILVNSAGINIRIPAEDYTEEAWDKVQDIQLKGVFFACQAAAKYWIANGICGRIVNISSVNAAVMARKDIVSYIAAKAGVCQMTKVLAAEWAKYGIRVNGIAPGWFKTEITKKLFEDADTCNEILSHIPAKRLGNADTDLAGAAIYLASDASGYTTGQTIFIDGGYTCI